ncbi:hypothetical protein OFN97_06655 [Campylobacter sp. VBCF_05 NA6]|uniref:hypothetical protein n=1 Tax=unclassified Campylobacter TaxID=2593542 RepID=UPI0022E9EFB4|nr:MULTISPECIES: hypothetical protein [unclassified Campylobacter]MDA3058123.1 hypothetical protein [Campylobacter sp. VBCF_04 NA7]MDA3059694.1 hypothetical protein [Campylobacter sp. VBCF_05 NA6]
MAKYTEHPFEKNKFTMLFDDSEFNVAVGKDKISKRNIVAIRWCIDTNEHSDELGYPTNFNPCKYKNPAKLWVRIQKCLLIEFLEILKDKNGAKVEEIEETIKRIKENEEDFI